MPERNEVKPPEDPPEEAPRAEEPKAPRRRRHASSIEHGVALIQAELKNLSPGPGVYRMLDADGNALYVGKARSLKKRVASYAHPAKLSNRIRRMIAETASLEFVTTHTEVEALLLEINLIKRLMPRYNVLLRDDKSFPNILVTGDHPYPQILKHRGAKARAGDYFGPFASAGAVARTITALQRAFLLRNCSDAVFAQRTRPCLQYQIKRCSAPCVGHISEADYGALVRQAKDFLTGKSGEVQAELAQEMQQASDALDFERAARSRDRIRALAHVRSHQDINVEGVADADVVALAQEAGQTCVQVFFFRGSSNYGNRAYFPSHEKGMEPADVLAAFLGQFYDNKPPPPLVLTSHVPAEQDLIAEALSLRAGRRVELSAPQRGAKRKLIEHALANAAEALARRLAESASQRRLLDGVAAVFGLEAPPRRIEIYDNSHISGTNATGAMVVAGPEGSMKSAYRKFTIRSPELAPGDDYAMMREVLSRHFGRALKEDPERARGTWPDLVLIDGGQGQLAAAQGVLTELGVTDVPLVAIAKGPDRDAGRERFFQPGRNEFQLEPRDPVLYFLQRLRDEAHRFAIETHRAKRAKALGRSELDEVAGIGARRKKALLLHFGSVREIKRAGLADLERVSGISRAVAARIYSHFHEDG
ncbi:MAG: excinuclease ABC subunit UvrC [Proteobacteria bacterium]|nr:excinuclease ABC subunit UvrC [Pseudomonadota bacterium]